MMASNNWAVSGKKTKSGKPIIANDPHLEINRLPNVWYEMALKTSDSYAMGGTMPGAPALLVGRNPDLAWSATYTFMDGTDSWIEHCKDGKYFREPGEWLDFKQRKEIIKRKKKDSVTVTFYENNWQGFENPEDLPRSYNPECGYLVTTNQDLNEYGNVDPINVGMGPYRSDRIGDLLEKNNAIDCEYMYKRHYDVFSTQAESFMAILAPLLPDSKQAAILKKWNFEYDADSEGASLFDRFYKQLYNDVFGKNGFGLNAVEHIDKHTGMFNYFYINFDRILLSEKSSWFGGRTL